jgi:adenosine/AMP kinase
MSEPTRNVDVIVGNTETHETVLQLVDGATVLQTLFLEPDEAEDIGDRLKKYSAIARAKRQGFAGSA